MMIIKSSSAGAWQSSGPKNIFILSCKQAGPRNEIVLQPDYSKGITIREVPSPGQPSTYQPQNGRKFGFASEIQIMMMLSMIDNKHSFKYSERTRQNHYMGFDSVRKNNQSTNPLFRRLIQQRQTTVCSGLFRRGFRLFMER